ncbi:MAG TPA: cupin domain-containing protein, partial [Thermoleophilaceae bacterium]
MVEEARLEQLEAGLTPVTEGWFVVNVRDAAWVTNEAMGDACIIEGDDVSFPEIGFTICVLQPGQPNGMYHREPNQEDFLVLSGECLLLVEGEERPLKAWDFVHCPADTEHIFVGAG